MHAWPDLDDVANDCYSPQLVCLFPTTTPKTHPQLREKKTNRFIYRRTGWPDSIEGWNRQSKGTLGGRKLRMGATDENEAGRDNDNMTPTTTRSIELKQPR